MADQGKNKRKQIEAEDSLHGKILSVDSQEEQFYIDWLCEAASISAIDDFVYQPCTFKLFDSIDYRDVDGKKRCLFRDHVYSPDFLVVFNPNKNKDLSKEFKIRQDQLSSDQVSAWIDTKGTFNLNKRSFSADRKWIWQKFGIYICEVIPKFFFKKFGCPIRSFYSQKTKKPRKIFQGFKSVKQIFGVS